MPKRFRSFTSLLLCFVASSLFAQLPPVATDPLHPTQAIQGAAACSTTEASSCAQAAAKISPLVMGESPLEENLRKLTDDIGGRISGSPEMAKAVDWAIASFRAEGVSPATPPEGLEAVLVDIGYGSQNDFAAAGASVKGAILLVRADIDSTFADLVEEYLRPPEIIDRAVKAGAVAILWTGQRERKLLYRHTNSSVGKPDVLPQAVVAREDALRLARVAAVSPAKLRVRLVMPNKLTGPVEQVNVVGEIRGYEKPDEIVVLGAHLDSWDLGTGALDNGCNAALVIEAARAIKASGLLPRRTIRFILFSGEQQGTIGSWAYVHGHRAEMDKYRGMVVFDTGIGRVTGYSFGGRRDIEPAVREILKPFSGWYVDNLTYDATFGTDNLDFLLEGIPTLMANQEVANYLENYHASSDTFDKVDIRELKLNTVLAAVTAWGIADRVEPIGKRQTRAEVEALMKETRLDQQLKTLGMWDDWQSGTRGRQP